MKPENWGHLQLLWLLSIVPVLVVAYAFDGQRRRRVLERIGHMAMIRKMTASYSPARRRWRAILTVAAVGLLVITLARPQMQGKGRLTEHRGLDLVVALDFSKSMLARDVYPTRLERAKAELGHLIDTLKGDRVGLVAFAGETMAYPLTVDYEAAKLFWRDLQPSDMPVGGTDLGRAISASQELLKQSHDAAIARRPDRKHIPAQVILLLTDGEDTEGRGIEAARRAAQDGVKIFTLGIGSNERPFVQTYDDDGKPNGMLPDNEGRPLRVGLDDTALRQIANLTGGDYLPIDPKRFGVERVQQAIAGLQRTEEEARFEREPEDIGRYLLVPAFILLVLSALVRERKRVAVEVQEPVVAQPTRRDPTGRRSLAAAILLILFPFVTGFDLFLRRDPNIEEGNRLLQAGKADEALKAFDRAAESLPEEPVVRFDRGTALYQLGKYPEAQKEFQRALEGKDQALKADSYYNMGNSLFKQERWKEALDAYKHTLGLRPDDRRAKWNLELALRRVREEQQKQQQQQQSQNQDQKNQDPKNQQDQQQQQQQQDQQKKDQQQQQAQQDQKKDQQQQQDQKKDQQQPQNDPKKDQQQAKDEQKKRDEQQKAQERESDEAAKREREKRKPVKEIDKQDAEAVLDALERVEPTVQKDLARHRAGNRRPSKDW